MAVPAIPARRPIEKRVMPMRRDCLFITEGPAPQPADHINRGDGRNAGYGLRALRARWNGPPGGGPLLLLVEVARIELASASPLPRGLHAYSVFGLTVGYPTGRENLQPAQ